MTQRLKIVKEVQWGAKRSMVAAKWNVGASYISKLMNPEKIAELEKIRHMELNQDALRAPKTATKIGVSGSMIQAQALKIVAQMGKNNFKATNGWLHRFLKRYSFTHVQLHGEAGDVDKQKVAEEIERIRKHLQEFDVEFIFDMDETGLFFRCFPRGTYVTKGEAAAGVNSETVRGSKAMKAKDRCTVVACCNTAGSLMVPLAVISTSKKRVVFRLVRKPPCPYFAQDSAWLDAAIYQRWFDEVFVPFVKGKTSTKVALLWDKGPGHKIKSNDPQIVVIFLPPNVPSVYQPMGMGILLVLKRQYKTEMVARLADLIEDWDTVRARQLQRGCRGLSDAGQVTMLDVTEICSQK
ncbi:unnamed protein product [Ectocarpus sp. CCAP 1310/34]|nr:unnamed protein product [Ectocarpus sp. CCAP 1310/34]